MDTETSRLIRELSNDDPMVRRDAARALGEARAVDAVEALAALLCRAENSAEDESHPEHSSRAAAAVALGRIGDPRAASALLEAMADPFNVGTAASTAIGRLVPPPLQVLLAATRDGNAWRRARTVMALGEIGDSAAFETMVELLDDPDASVRRAAASAFEKLRDPRAIAPLLSLFIRSDESAFVRSYAAMTLGALKASEAVEALTEALDSSEVLLRRSAARALCRIGDPGSRNRLEALARTDPDRTVRQIIDRYVTPRPGQRPH